MTTEELKVRYPHLFQTLEIVSTDNGMPFHEEITLPPFLVPSLALAENQASQLSDDEKEVIATGDDAAREDLVDRTGFVVLDDFLTEAFEGILSETFWRP